MATKKKAVPAYQFMLAILNALHPGWEQEHRFHPTRMWRFDFALPAKKLAVEVEGGVWINGRHTRGSGFIRDAEKYNEAVVIGWRVLRVTPKSLKDGSLLQLLERALS